jgi:hypothetical protein
MPNSQKKVLPSSCYTISGIFDFRLYYEQLNFIEFVAFPLFYKDHAIENNSSITKKKDIAMKFVYSIFLQQTQIQTGSLCLYIILLSILINSKHSFYLPSLIDMEGFAGQKGSLIFLGRIC